VAAVDSAVAVHQEAGKPYILYVDNQICFSCRCMNI